MYKSVLWFIAWHRGNLYKKHEKFICCHCIDSTGPMCLYPFSARKKFHLAKRINNRHETVENKTNVVVASKKYKKSNGQLCTKV